MSDVIKTLTYINKVDIQIVERGGEKFVPIKPICEAVGVDVNGQIQRIERDEILTPTTCVIQAVAADGKEREMYCLPFKFVFGWLFGIDAGRVKAEARDTVVAYKLECYNALFLHFTSRADFVEKKQIEIDRQLEIVGNARGDFRNAKNILAYAESKLDTLRRLTIDDYDMERRQLKLNFD